MASAPALSLEAAQSWIYPSNYPPRAYQLSIVQRALFENTLVCLPTGLGKTLVAAVVMYNFYLWYPTGSVVFLVSNCSYVHDPFLNAFLQAPTKPLVSQQIKACREITGIPEDEVAHLDGAVDAERRYALWKQKRVFFCTPQVLENDLVSDTCNGHRIMCLVFDEAHRTTGNYSYVKIVRQFFINSCVSSYFCSTSDEIFIEERLFSKSPCSDCDSGGGFASNTAGFMLTVSRYLRLLFETSLSLLSRLCIIWRYQPWSSAARMMKT